MKGDIWFTFLKKKLLFIQQRSPQEPSQGNLPRRKKRERQPLDVTAKPSTHHRVPRTNGNMGHIRSEMQRRRSEALLRRRQLEKSNQDLRNMPNPNRMLKLRYHIRNHRRHLGRQNSNRARLRQRRSHIRTQRRTKVSAT